MKITALALALLLALLVPVPTASAAPPGVPSGSPAAESPLQRSTRLLVDQVRERPDVTAVDGLLSASFRASVPAAQVAKLLADVAGEHGAATGFRLEEARGPHAGVFEVLLPDGHAFPLTVTVSGAPPHPLVGLWMGPTHPVAESWEALVERFAALPGRAGLMLARLDEKGFTPLVELRPDEAFAIGSTFKLYVLGALVAGEVPWDRVVHLRREDRSLPSGVLQTWPVGAPLTVHTLATQMISISDNTATDTLLRVVGREAVERQLRRMGNTHASRSIPFLTTREMFVLATREPLRRRYLRADRTGRRGLLADEIRAAELDVESMPEEPVAIEEIEWFASPRDLVRAMAWLRRHGEETVEGILGVNRGLDVPEAAFPVAGYKGGSDWGALNQTWLLEHRSGRRYVLTASWNDPDRLLDEDRFFGLAQAALTLLARRGGEPDAGTGASGR